MVIYFLYKDLKPETFPVKGTKGKKYRFGDKTASSRKAFALLLPGGNCRHGTKEVAS